MVEHALAKPIAPSSRIPCVGPRATLCALSKENLSIDDWEVWAQGARVQAILGSCRLSIRSVVSGFRCYVAFCGEPSRVEGGWLCAPPPFVVQMRLVCRRRIGTHHRWTICWLGRKRFGAVAHGKTILDMLKRRVCSWACLLRCFVHRLRCAL